jgi:hypothetical protein
MRYAGHAPKGLQSDDALRAGYATGLHHSALSVYAGCKARRSLLSLFAVFCVLRRAAQSRENYSSRAASMPVLRQAERFHLSPRREQNARDWKRLHLRVLWEARHLLPPRFAQAYAAGSRGTRHRSSRRNAPRSMAPAAGQQEGGAELSAPSLANYAKTARSEHHFLIRMLR